MAPLMPTGLLVLAMLVGQAAGFAKAPKDKDAADKGDRGREDGPGDVRDGQTERDALFE